MWRPRLRLASEDSGGPGTRPGGIKTALRGARWTGIGQTVAQAAASSQEARTWGQKTPRWSAGRREPLARGSRRKAELKTLRRPALRPLRLGRREKKGSRRPRAVKNRGDFARLRPLPHPHSHWHKSPHG